MGSASPFLLALGSVIHTKCDEPTMEGQLDQGETITRLRVMDRVGRSRAMT